MFSHSCCFGMADAADIVAAANLTAAADVAASAE
jgi:hypothetical protein